MNHKLSLTLNEFEKEHQNQSETKHLMIFSLSAGRFCLFRIARFANMMTIFKHKVLYRINRWRRFGLVNEKVQSVVATFERLFAWKTNETWILSKTSEHAIGEEMWVANILCAISDFESQRLSQQSVVDKIHRAILLGNEPKQKHERELEERRISHQV